MNNKNEYKSIEAYKTKDGSIIRELMHPAKDACKNVSLAEAIVEPNQETFLHKHIKSEEIYHITQGCGVMQLGEKEFEVKEKDSIYIPPGKPHKIKNTNKVALKILCICSPAYSHEDTVIL